MDVKAEGRSSFIFVCCINEGSFESISVIAAFAAYSAITCRQAPQGATPPSEAMAKALKSVKPSVRALKIATRSAQQLSP